MENIFKRGERNTYSNEEKLKLGEFVAKFKEEYDAEVALFRSFFNTPLSIKF